MENETYNNNILHNLHIFDYFDLNLFFFPKSQFEHNYYTMIIRDYKSTQYHS